MHLSHEGMRLSHKSGLRTIMDDIAETLAKGANAKDYINLSIGNPANIPEVNARWHSLVRRVSRGDVPASVDSYGPSRGEDCLIQEVINTFGKHYGWSLKPENIVVGPGSQFLCYAAGVLFSGPNANGDGRRPTILPRLPDYTGYEGLGAPQQGLMGIAPDVQETGTRGFRYDMRHRSVAALEDVGLLIASTPSNPTAQELTRRDAQVILDTATRLDATAMFDHAYGAPFPCVAPNAHAPIQHPNLINCFSLSKAGLPGARVGIAIGAPDRIEALTAFVANSALHACRTSQNIAAAALGEGHLDEVSTLHIAPYYTEAVQQAIDILHRCLPRELNWKVHTNKGGMFLWLWIDEPGFDDMAFYQRAKAKGVFVTPGSSFFLCPDKRHPWMRQCLRISLNQGPALLEAGLGRIAQCLERELA